MGHPDALQLQTKSRRKKRRRRDEEDDDEEDYDDDTYGGKKSRHSLQRERTPQQASKYANGSGNAKSPYVEEPDPVYGSDAEEDARRAQNAAKGNAVAALLEPEELNDFDDEVERVISHR